MQLITLFRRKSWPDCVIIEVVYVIGTRLQVMKLVYEPALTSPKLLTHSKNEPLFEREVTSIVTKLTYFMSKLLQITLRKYL